MVREDHGCWGCLRMGQCSTLQIKPTSINHTEQSQKETSAAKQGCLQLFNIKLQEISIWACTQRREACRQVVEQPSQNIQCCKEPQLLYSGQPIQEMHHGRSNPTFNAPLMANLPTTMCCWSTKSLISRKKRPTYLVTTKMASWVWSLRWNHLCNLLQNSAISLRRKRYLLPKKSLPRSQSLLKRKEEMDITRRSCLS